VVPAAAQGSIDSETMKVDIPFDFVVGETSLPAGTYEVEIGEGKTDPPVLVIQTHNSEDELHFRRVMALASPGRHGRGEPSAGVQQGWRSPLSRGGGSGVGQGAGDALTLSAIEATPVASTVTWKEVP
jgi:hypothetical protein